jgi:hypothetical protein
MKKEDGGKLVGGANNIVHCTHQYINQYKKIKKKEMTMFENALN